MAAPSHLGYLLVARYPPRYRDAVTKTTLAAKEWVSQWTSQRVLPLEDAWSELKECHVSLFEFVDESAAKQWFAKSLAAINTSEMDVLLVPMQRPLSSQPTFMLLQLELTDSATFLGEYVPGTASSMSQYGSNAAVCVSPEWKCLKGRWVHDGNLFVLHQFDSVDKAEQWHRSEEYRPWKDIRLRCAKTQSVIVHTE